MFPQDWPAIDIPVIGLVGGVASGKSLVARQLAKLGAGVLDGDRAGHDVLRMPEIERAVRERWGDNVFGEDGRIDRARLARIVFAPPPDGPPELRRLEELTHPRIGEMLCRQAAQLAGRGLPALVLDAPVMLKTGWDKVCDYCVYVDAPRDVRLARALARGWSAEGFARREAAQEAEETKRQRADFVIDNSGPPEATREQVERVWRQIVT